MVSLLLAVLLVLEEEPPLLPPERARGEEAPQVKRPEPGLDGTGETMDEAMVAAADTAASADEDS
jgi:hypothetical protein